MNEPVPRHSKLHRLDDSYYMGLNWVHWNMTIDKRSTGWLTDLIHLKIREALIHTLIRYRLSCPVYCLMPDHGHFLWGGLASDSHQIKASKFFRQEWNRILNEIADGSFRLQKQPFDHVLKEEECNKNSGFKSIAGYILENPVRAGLVDHFHDWAWLGAVVPTYRRMNPREVEFWDRYWTAHYKLQDTFEAADDAT